VEADTYIILCYIVCREKEENQLEQVKFQLEAESRKREQVEDLLSNLKSVSIIIDYYIFQSSL